MNSLEVVNLHWQGMNFENKFDKNLSGTGQQYLTHLQREGVKAQIIAQSFFILFFNHSTPK